MKNSVIKNSITKFAGFDIGDKIRIARDTTNFTELLRNMVLELEGEYYLIKGSMFFSGGIAS